MANNTALAKVDQFKGILNSQTIRAQLYNSLKENAGAFMSSMIDLYSGDTQLQKCDPEKVALECVKAAALNLPIVKSLGFAYVVPYKGVPTFTVGYRGLIQLAQRSGQYRIINADVVYEGEFRGSNKLTGGIDLGGQKISDTVTGYFAYFKLTNGFEKVLYMSKDEIDQHAKRYSPSFNSSYSPWKTEFDKMALKTVLRKLISTYGPMSADMQKAISNDEVECIQQEIADNANKIPLTVDSDTGEVIDEQYNTIDDITEDDLP